MLAQTLPLNSPLVSPLPEPGGVRGGRSGRDATVRFGDELTRASSRRSAQDAPEAQEPRATRAETVQPKDGPVRPSDDAVPEAPSEDQLPDGEEAADEAGAIDGDPDGEPGTVGAASEPRTRSSAAETVPSDTDADGTGGPDSGALRDSVDAHAAKAAPHSGGDGRANPDAGVTIHSDSDGAGTDSGAGEDDSGFANSGGSGSGRDAVRAAVSPEAGEHLDPDHGIDDAKSSKSGSSQHMDLGTLESKASGATSVLQLEVESAASPKSGESAGKLTQAAGQSALTSHSNPSEDSEGAFRSGVTRGLGAALQQKGGSLTIRLSPESLGSLRIQMTLGDGHVSVRMETLNEQAQQMLMRSMPMLRESLESKGLTVREIQVTPTLAQPSPAPGPDARQEPAQDHGGKREGSGQDQEAGGGENERERGDGSGRDQHDGFEDLSEHWFEQRLRMTLNTVA